MKQDFRFASKCCEIFVSIGLAVDILHSRPCQRVPRRRIPATQNCRDKASVAGVVIRLSTAGSGELLFDAGMSGPSLWLNYALPTWNRRLAEMDGGLMKHRLKNASIP
jgi:hypothetical protein